MRTARLFTRTQVTRTLMALGLAGATVFTSSAASAQTAEPKVLNVLNWADYIGPDTIAKFEKETGIKVRYDTFDANETLHAKLIAGKTGYDVVVPSSHFAKRQIEAGIFLPLDRAQLPNWKNLDPTPATSTSSPGCGASSPSASTSTRSRPHSAPRRCPRMRWI